MTSRFKTSRKWAWLTMLLIGMLTVGITSCDEDDTSNVTPDPDNGQEVESAWLYGFNQNTPSGFVNYLAVYEDHPSKVDVKNAVEIGASNAGLVFSYEENPYTWNGDASTITKWSIDKTTLEINVSGLMSLATYGISNFEPFFVSQNEAYAFDLAEGIIVKWNPSEMEVLEEINVDPIPTVSNNTAFLGMMKGSELNGLYVVPISYDPGECCDWESIGGAMVAVFDPASKSLKYYSDERSMSTDWIVKGDDGNIYVLSNWTSAFVHKYYDVDPNDLEPANTILRLNQDGTFDENFELNLDTVIGEITMSENTVGIVDGKIGLNYYYRESGLSDFENRWDIWEDPANTKYSIVDLQTKEVSSFNGFEGLNLNGAWPVNNVEGRTYLGGGHNGWQDSYILRQNSINNYEIVTSVDNGAIFTFNKLW